MWKAEKGPSPAAENWAVSLYLLLHASLEKDLPGQRAYNRTPSALVMGSARGKAGLVLSPHCPVSLEMPLFKAQNQSQGPFFTLYAE